MSSRFLIVTTTLLTLVWPTLSVADLYKGMDDDGKIIYSDKPFQGANKIEAPAITTYKPSTNTQSTNKQTKPPSDLIRTRYNKLVITKPADEFTIRNNTGTVEVELELKPALAVRSGDKIQLFLDNKKVAEFQGVKYQLQNIDRGEHSVELRIVDRSGKTLKKSTPITFHLKRNSSRHKFNKKKAGKS